MTSPTLYIVSTPIGNLSDFSAHGQSILKSVSFILCEDTRHTLKLLNHFGIQNKLESLHVHNEKSKMDYILDKLLQSSSQSVALVSDAGTPAICDPGSYLVTAAHEKNIEIRIVPGPSSLTSAISASGFIQPRTLFSGFLPKSKKDQFVEFAIWVQATPCLAVFFESPKRIEESLNNLFEFFKTQMNQEELSLIEICTSREISKKFEEHKRMKLPEAIEFYRQKEEIQGEFVCCVNLNKITQEENIVTLEEASKEAYLNSELKKLPLKTCCKLIAEKYNFNSKDVYGIACKLKE